jgi:hypothetical protein
MPYCRKCGSINTRGLFLCTNCGAELPKPTEKGMIRSHPIISGVVALAILFMIGAIAGNVDNSSENVQGFKRSGDIPTRIEAFVVASDQIEQRLKAPSTADFPSAGESQILIDPQQQIYTIRSYVDSENDFGAKLRKSWSCKLRYISGEWTDIRSWELLYIGIDE